MGYQNAILIVQYIFMCYDSKSNIG